MVHMACIGSRDAGKAAASRLCTGCKACALCRHTQGTQRRRRCACVQHPKSGTAAQMGADGGRGRTTRSANDNGIDQSPGSRTLCSSFTVMAQHARCGLVGCSYCTSATIPDRRGATHEQVHETVHFRNGTASVQGSYQGPPPASNIVHNLTHTPHTHTQACNLAQANNKTGATKSSRRYCLHTARPHIHVRTHGRSDHCDCRRLAKRSPLLIAPTLPGSGWGLLRS